MHVAEWAIAVKDRDGWVCSECGSENNIHAHHLNPRALGGTHVLENGITLCRPCHFKKHRGSMSGAGLGLKNGNLTLREWKEKLNFTLDPAVIAAVRAIAQEEDRPISNAIGLLLKEALAARGRLVGDPAPNPPRKGIGKPRPLAE